MFELLAETTIYEVAIAIILIVLVGVLGLSSISHGRKKKGKDPEAILIGVLVLFGTVILAGYFKFTVFDDYLAVYSLDETSNHVADEDAEYYTVDRDHLASVIEDKYDLSRTKVEEMNYLEDRNEYTGNGTAYFEGEIMVFYIVVDPDSEVTLAPYSTSYTEAELLR